MPVPRTVPSSIFAYFMVFRSRASSLTSASCSSGVQAMAFVKFIFMPSGRRSGIALQSRFEISKGRPSTRATSLIEFLVAIVEYVIMCAQFSAPYLLITHCNTFPRPSSSKSVSISGRFTRSGFRKRSNSKSYFKGSIRVIPKQ